MMNDEATQIANQAKILSDEKQIIEEEKGLLKKINGNVHRLALSLECARLDEYASMLSKPWRFFFLNFVLGIFRGVGFAIGMTIVAAFLLYILVKVLSNFVDIPIIGMYIAQIVEFVEQYMNKGVMTH
ncbi:MAG: hypothetical protein HQ596_00545 [Candidatus Saganbacteria bacterium]|nr:hypothetical protein [Candidatus Saganbacteria bacterium]